METGEIIALLIVGALAGTAAATLLGERKDRSTTDLIRNTVIGVVGAVVGSFIFNALDFDLPASLEESISLADVIVAFVGAVVVLIAARIIR